MKMTPLLVYSIERQVQVNYDINQVTNMLLPLICFLLKSSCRKLRQTNNLFCKIIALITTLKLHVHENVMSELLSIYLIDGTPSINRNEPCNF